LRLSNFRGSRHNGPGKRRAKKPKISPAVKAQLKLAALKKKFNKALVRVAITRKNPKVVLRLKKKFMKAAKSISQPGWAGKLKPRRNRKPKFVAKGIKKIKKPKKPKKPKKKGGKKDKKKPKKPGKPKKASKGKKPKKAGKPNIAGKKGS
jgi:hypothetical protein